MVSAIIIVGIAVLLVLLFVGIYNGLVRWKNTVKNAWSQIDVQLKRRYDLIPNLIETVKGYAKHEKELLENVTKARTACMQAKGVGEIAQAENSLNQTLKSLFAVAENYPDLKANQNFLALQEELTSTENKISFARQFYNDSVMRYNTKIQTFPAVIIANMFHFGPEEFFQIAETEKQAIKVQF